MHDVPLPDQLYRRAAKAAEANRVSLESFVAEAVKLYLLDADDNLDHLFTPEVLKAIDLGATEAREGKSLTIEQVEEHFVAKQREWQENRAG